MLQDLIKAISFNLSQQDSGSVHAIPSDVKVKVVGVGGAGGNAVSRMVRTGLTQVDTLVLNTDIQALASLSSIPSYAIGPQTVKGMGSGGRPEVGRRAVKESREHIAELLDGSDMVFITAGMGGGTGTGASATVADLARKLRRPHGRRSYTAVLIRRRETTRGRRAGNPQPWPEGRHPCCRRK